VAISNAAINGRHIEQVLERYSSTMIFADLNLKLNVLWVIVRPGPGICWNLPTAINS
jgi:hypothetical protein